MVNPSSPNSKNGIPASDKIRPDDFSEAHELPVDLIGTHKQYRNLQDNIYGYIHEVVQNMFDSTDRGEPNRLEIRINPRGHDPSVWFKDRGPHGITKDYKGDVDAFISAMKATTEKEIIRGLKRKGIGMFQYTNIAPKVIITSMDKEMIYRIPMWVTPEGATAYGHVSKKPILQKYMDYFGIYESGTIVAFHERPLDASEIKQKEVIKSIREKWALRLYDEKRVDFKVGETHILPPQWIIDHPPRLLQRMMGGADIRGNIWYDEKGNGNIRGFQDGYLVEFVGTEFRQCTGYVECNALQTDAGRIKFLKDNRMWNDFKERMVREVSKFPKIAQESQDEKNVLKVRELALQILDLKRSPTAYGSTNDFEKILTTGGRGGDEVIGYPVSGEDPDPNRERIEREEHTRDNDHQTTISEEGDDKVKKGGQDVKSPRSKHAALDFQENRHLGSDKPLFVLDRDQRPPLLRENADNIEHEIYAMLKGSATSIARMYNCKLLDWLSEVNLESHGILTEGLRMEMSKERYSVWKQTGYLKAKNVLGGVEARTQ